METIAIMMMMMIGIDGVYELHQKKQKNKNCVRMSRSVLLSKNTPERTPPTPFPCAWLFAKMFRLFVISRQAGYLVGGPLGRTAAQHAGTPGPVLVRRVARVLQR